MISKTKKLLAERIQKNRRRILEWQQAQAQKAPPPFYCSIDLRDSGYKIAPVDSNLYPAGFNNICPEDLRASPAIIKKQIELLSAQSLNPHPKKILILPESHTQNTYYLENLFYLKQLIENADYEVRIGWYGPLPEGMHSPLQLKTQTEKLVEAYAIEIKGGVASAGDFVPDLIILNNDFSGGYPEPLDQVAQPILPSHSLGWHSRKKSEHFVYYNQLAQEFANILEIDPWILQIDTEEVAPVNFNEEQGTELVAESVTRVLSRTQKAYDIHKVTRKPFAFVKNNSGTYGMGIMVVHSADELKKMNRRTKNKMSVGKSSHPIDSVVVQEGVPTATLIDRLAAEPVIYLVGGELIGGFLRTNTEKGDEENLNSQGMVFRKLCMSDLRNHDEDFSDENVNLKEEPVLELVYGAIAQISALASGMELQAHRRVIPKPVQQPVS